MKPNDKAIEAGVKLCWNCPRATPSMIRDILEAAYTAQFPPSEDYAGLVKELRKVEPDLPGDRTRWYRNPNGPDAADALEAVLAERDALKAELAAANKRAANRLAVEAERDALLARLAPVDDEELVEIAAYYFTDGSSWSALSERLRNICRRDARNAIAAIRPHIEALERERCAKIVELDCDRHSTYAIAGAIRSGK